MRAFAFWFAIALLAFWAMLSIEHGRAAGKGIRKAMRQFFKGRRGKGRGKNE